MTIQSKNVKPRFAINIRCPEDLYRCVRASATLHDRSMSSEVIQILRAHFDTSAHGTSIPQHNHFATSA